MHFLLLAYWLFLSRLGHESGAEVQLVRTGTGRGWCVPCMVTHFFSLVDSRLYWLLNIEDDF